MRVGIDVGGTFTDVIGMDDAAGRIVVKKVPTVPADPSVGVVGGIEKLGVEAVDLVVHGTTIGTNALLERKGASTGLLTTAGFRDVLEIGRVQRPEEGLYDFNVDNPPPLVARALRLEATERVDAQGQVVTPLDEASVKRAAEAFRREGVKAVGVTFLFSFLRPEHERRAREILERELPGVVIALSSDICPEFREYERTSTTVIAAYLAPVAEAYVERLTARLRERFPGAGLRLIQANGGAMRAASAKGRSVHLVNSGPAGGATAGAYLGRLTGESKIISVDMGGTSFDISLIDGGMPRVTTESKFEGLPIRIPMIDLHVIGAGGGSIAWVDAGRALSVGPHSAGAVPGPVSYAKGGREPTVTDANVALGRIDPAYFLGGEVPLDAERAREAIRRVVAGPTGLSFEDAAGGILRVINAKMEKGIAARSIQRGYDLREFALAPFGGAGPLHAVEMAQDLGMKRVVVPPFPGAFSAFGLLVADVRHDYVRTLMWGEGALDAARLAGVYRELEAEGLAELERDGVAPADREIHWSADLRFEGQSYELNVPVARADRPDVARVLADFATAHERIYSFRAVDERTVVVSARVTAIGRTAEVKLPRLPEGGRDATKAKKGERPVWFPGVGFVRSAICERSRLCAGNVVEGPAVIEEEISCTVVPPGTAARVDAWGNLVVEVG